eukprot:PhF_6_TR11264/c0_g1_i1/m.18171
MPPKKPTAKKDKVEEKKEEKEIVLPDGQRTLFIGGWSTLKDLQAALAVYAPGDKLIFLPGEHDVSNATLSQPELDIKGSGNDPSAVVLKGNVTLTSPNNSADPTKVDPKLWSKGTIQGVTFEGQVTVQRSHITIEGCQFRGGQRQLLIYHYCTPLIKKNVFLGSSQSNIACYPLSNPTIEENTFQDGVRPNDVGLLLQDSLATVNKNTFQRLTSGITIAGKNQKPNITANTLQNITGTGIFLTSGTGASLKKNVISSCEYYGIQVDGGAVAEVFGNTIDGNVKICRGSHPVFRANTVTRHYADMNEERDVPFEAVY